MMKLSQSMAALLLTSQRHMEKQLKYVRIGPGKRSVLSKSMQNHSTYMPGKCAGLGTSAVKRACLNEEKV